MVTGSTDSVTAQGCRSFECLSVMPFEVHPTTSSTITVPVTADRVRALAIHRRCDRPSMVAAIDDEDSALHASCVSMKAAGAKLLAHAQAESVARTDIDGADLFALVAALAWLGDQPALAPRADHLFGVIAGSLLVTGAGGDAKVKTRARVAGSKSRR